MAQERNPDFEDLEGMNLPQEILESVKQARIEARTIISKLEPCHITSWTDLIIRLGDSLERAKTAARHDIVAHQAVR